MKNEYIENYWKAFGKRAKFFRTEKKWGLKVVALESGLQISVISDIERGRRQIYRETEEKLFKGLGVTRSQFFDTDELRAFEGINVRPCLGPVCCRKCLEPIGPAR
jgi:transcriptional regulator with XRE-family HTH domain